MRKEDFKVGQTILWETLFLVSLLLMQVAAPYNPRSSGSVTILSAVQPAPAITTAGATFAQHPPAQLSSFNPHAAATNPQFTSFTPLPTTTCSITPFTQPAMQTLTTQHHHHQQQQQPAPQSQQITITLPEKPTPTILRRTPTKAGIDIWFHHLDFCGCMITF